MMYFDTIFHMNPNFQSGLFEKSCIKEFFGMFHIHFDSSVIYIAFPKIKMTFVSQFYSFKYSLFAFSKD